MVSKNRLITAKSGDNDITIRFYVAQDGYYAGSVMAQVFIETDEPAPGNIEYIEYVVANMSELTGAEKTGLRTVLKKIRDAGLTDLGFA